MLGPTDHKFHGHTVKTMDLSHMSKQSNNAVVFANTYAYKHHQEKNQRK